MPTTLGRQYQIDWRGRPPHMLDSDIPVWYAFLEKWGFLFLSLYYDCYLGGPPMTEEDFKDPFKRMWWANTSKRADAIADLKDELWIIEVAQRPGLRALGQLQVYSYLWREDPKIDKPVRLVLVCHEVDKDLFAAAAVNGILIYVTVPPGS